MTHRERFQRLMHYQSVDRGIHWDFGYLDEAMDRWVEEGLPADVGGSDIPGDRMGRISDYFGKDPVKYVPSIMGLHPGFPYEVIEVRERTVVSRDSEGNIVEEIKEGEHTIPHVIENGLKGREDWKKYKDRLDTAHPDRHQWDYKAMAAEFNKADVPVIVNLGSFMGWIRDWVGAANLGYLCYDDPELLEEMVNHLCNLYYDMLEPIVKHISVDLAWGWEDICFNNGPLVGPNIWRKIVAAPMTRVLKMLRQYGVDIIMTDCDGNVQSLVPVWLDFGLNAMFPCEVAGNSDPVVLREKFGRDLLLFGGVNKRMLTSKADILTELKRLAPLLEDGGYIPFVDHRIPGYVSYENHKYYEREKMAMLGFRQSEVDEILPLKGMKETTLKSLYR